jgi:hypothetical protein
MSSLYFANIQLILDLILYKVNNIASEYEINQSPLISAHVKNECSYIYTQLICLHGVYKENLSFVKLRKLLKCTAGLISDSQRPYINGNFISKLDKWKYKTHYLHITLYLVAFTKQFLPWKSK